MQNSIPAAGFNLAAPHFHKYDTTIATVNIYNFGWFCQFHTQKAQTFSLQIVLTLLKWFLFMSTTYKALSHKIALSIHRSNSFVGTWKEKLSDKTLYICFVKRPLYSLFYETNVSNKIPTVIIFNYKFKCICTWTTFYNHTNLG